MICSKHEVLTVLCIILNVMLLFHLLKEVCCHLMSGLGIFLFCRFLQRAIKENIDIPGKAVLITGCDTVKLIHYVQSTLVISKSKGPSKTLRDIRTSTYQICSIEEKTI